MEAVSGRGLLNRVAARERPLRWAAKRRSTGRIYASEQISSTATGAPVREVGAFSVLGTSRKNNEDRYDYQFVTDSAEAGEINTYVAIFDGHGGTAVSERLEATFRDEVSKFWSMSDPEGAISKACISMDRQLLERPAGFFGMFGERGVGGAKCGSTAATAFIYKVLHTQHSSIPHGVLQDKSGIQKLLTANVGDSRVVLVRDGEARQLTEDHVPDVEEERKRIERENPNPRMPLVRFVGRTWRVGGLLALSRAFGDAYMKANLDFEGVDAGSSYSTGFGVIARPYTATTDLKKGDTWLVVHSDGLNDTEIRGGGGGLTNEQVAEICSKSGDQSAQEVAEKLAQEAQKAGSTDDVSVVCIKLSA